MSKAPTTTDPDRLPNDDAGELLASEFMEPLGLTVSTLASAVAVSSERLDALLTGERPVDAGLDLRLTRYFGLSEGFFLRLQNSYDLLESKRTSNGDLDRIVPRAA